jgi:hypothetical protein
MAIIEVNSQSINFDETIHLNLKSIIPKLQKRFPNEEFSLEYFMINGNNIDIRSEDSALMRPICDKDIIEVSFLKNNNILPEILNDLSGLIDKILDHILTCTNLLKVDNSNNSTRQLSKIIAAMDLFLQTINHACSEILTEEEITTLLPVKDLQIHLLSIVKAINDAQQKHDDIMLTDLLEYELKDNLTQWKILILPTLKQRVLKNI